MWYTIQKQEILIGSRKHSLYIRLLEDEHHIYNNCYHVCHNHRQNLLIKKFMDTYIIVDLSIYSWKDGEASKRHTNAPGQHQKHDFKVLSNCYFSSINSILSLKYHCCHKRLLLQHQVWHTFPSVFKSTLYTTFCSFMFYIVYWFFWIWVSIYFDMHQSQSHSPGCMYLLYPWSPGP